MPLTRGVRGIRLTIRQLWYRPAAPARSTSGPPARAPSNQAALYTNGPQTSDPPLNERRSGKRAKARHEDCGAFAPRRHAGPSSNVRSCSPRPKAPVGRVDKELRLAGQLNFVSRRSGDGIYSVSVGLCASAPGENLRHRASPRPPIDPWKPLRRDIETASVDKFFDYRSLFQYDDYIILVNQQIIIIFLTN